MFGSGVHPSDVWGEIPSHSTSICIIEEQRNEMKHQSRDVTKELAEIHALLLPRRNSSSLPDSRIQSMVSNSSTTALRVDAYISILSMFDSTKVVAKGRIRNLDPSQVVGGLRLGEGWCEVVVLVPFYHDEQLIRPLDIIRTVGDSIGLSIAWPCHLVRIRKKIEYAFQ